MHALIQYGFFIHLLFLLSPLQVPGQTIRFIATVDRKELTVGEILTYTLEITGIEDSAAVNPELPAFSGLESINPVPEQTTAIQMIQGVRQKSRIFIYRLRATQAGLHRIGQAHLRHQNRIFRSNETAVNVLAFSADPSGAGSPDALLFRIETDRKELYPGESLIVHFNIYTRFPVGNIHLTRQPNFTGFWTEEIPVNEKTIQTTRLGEKNYRVFTLRSMHLFPMVAGSLRIDEAELECDLRIPRHREDIFSAPLSSFFSDPFGQTLTRRLLSTPVEIIVRPLPGKNRPSDFNGLVGQFDADLQVNRTQVQTGEPFQCRIVLTGKGNLMSADIHRPPVPDDFQIFPPLVHLKRRQTVAAMQGEKSFEWTVLAQKPGNYVIGPFTLSYFDPLTQLYHTRRTSAVTLSVQPSAALIRDTIPETNEPSIPAGIKTHFSHGNNTWRSHPWLFWILFFAPPVILTFFRIGQSAFHYLKIFQRQWQKRYITHEIKNQILKTHNPIPHSDPRPVYDQLKRLLLKYISIQYGIDISLPDWKIFEAVSAQTRAGKEETEQLRQLLFRLENGRFDPTADPHILEDSLRLFMHILNTPHSTMKTNNHTVT